MYATSSDVCVKAKSFQLKFSTLQQQVGGKTNHYLKLNLRFLCTVSVFIQKEITHIKFQEESTDSSLWIGFR